MKKFKYYHLRLEERNGEQEYDHDYLLRVKNEKEAWKLAHEQAAGWYGEDEDGNPEGTLIDGEENTYEFPGIWIEVSIASLTKTTKAQYIQHMLNMQMIGGYDQVCT